MPDHTTAPLTTEREQEIRDSIPTVYTAPWTVEPMEDNTWRVMYATDHPLAGLVCEVPDYGAHLAEFIAAARAAVPELLAEVDRLRAELATARGAAMSEGADAIDDMERRNAWPVRPVAAGICSEFLRGMAAGAMPDEEQPAAEVCGKCKRPFDPIDTASDGRGRYHRTPYCRRCIGLCRDSEIADHRCVICA